MIVRSLRSLPFTSDGKLTFRRYSATFTWSGLRISRDRWGSGYSPGRGAWNLSSRGSWDLVNIRSFVTNTILLFVMGAREPVESSTGSYSS